MKLQLPKIVEFDPSVKAHRMAVHAFMKRNAWGDTSMRFAHDPTYGSVAAQVREKLLNWYVFQEEIRGKKETPGILKI
jgi:hypothetical protein